MGHSPLEETPWQTGHSIESHTGSAETSKRGQFCLEAEVWRGKNTVEEETLFDKFPTETAMQQVRVAKETTAG